MTDFKVEISVVLNGSEMILENLQENIVRVEFVSNESSLEIDHDVNREVLKDLRLLANSELDEVLIKVRQFDDVGNYAFSTIYDCVPEVSVVPPVNSSSSKTFLFGSIQLEVSAADFYIVEQDTTVLDYLADEEGDGDEDTD